MNGLPEGQRRPSVIALLISLWAAGFVQADVVYLSQGDRLSGTVLGVEAGKLHLSTDYSGDLTLDWLQVQGLSLERPATVTFRDGQRLHAWLQTDEQGRGFLLTAFGKLPFDAAQIIALQPLSEGEREAFKQLDKPAAWSHRLEAGAQVRSGNVSSTDVTAALQSQRLAPKSELTTAASFAYGETEGERTAERAVGEGRFNLFHTSWLFSFYLANLERDALEDLDLRAQELVGVGANVVRTRRTLLRAEIGAGGRQELFSNGDQRVSPLARLGMAWHQTLGQATELILRATLLPDLGNLGAYRMEGEGALRVPLTTRFHLRLSLLDSYDSNPQPGVKRNDLTFLSALGWTF